MAIPKLPRGIKHEATPTAAQILGKAGGKARATKLTAKRRSEIAKQAAEARWAKQK